VVVIRKYKDWTSRRELFRGVINMDKIEFKYTQAIILRKDLGMSKGKLAVQAAHASIGAFYDMHTFSPDRVAWFNEGQRKIAFRAISEEHLIELYKKALALDLPCYLIEDFGLTEFHGVKTKTALGVGPCTIEKMKEFTDGLELF
jgi:PTH2 family peptidyl-tRNA hydrolase